MLSNKSAQLQIAIQHENAHFLQIKKMGLLNFYSKILSEYFKYGFHKSYVTPGTLENWAEMYAADRLGLIY